MKNKKTINPFFRLFSIVITLVVIAFITGIGLFYYIFAIPEPEGLSLASWTNTFTNNFSAWLVDETGDITVKDKGMEYLDEYGLWLQVIDENGQEVFAYHKPDNYPTRYSASELMAIPTSEYDNEYTVFTGSYEGTKQTYGYIIGFPYSIGKSVIYYNGENIGRLSPIFRTGIIVVLGAIFVFTLIYGLWLSRHLGKITKGIRDICQRTYKPSSNKGMFRDVYTALNEMDTEIRHSDKLQEDTERVRNEWITNISHDVKTPLSPIKGYAELLAENPTTDSNTAQEYGKGINEKEQSELFERYYRGTSTKEKPEGSGLGLAIAKQIIILHGGGISVNSKVNGGTEFIITLPSAT